MWIMLTKQLPVGPPTPPKLSVHWSTPWPYVPHNAEKITKKLWREYGLNKLRYDYNDWGGIIPHQAKLELAGMSAKALFGHDPKFATARKIKFEDNDIRAWDHEFSPMPPPKMRTLVGGGVFILQAGNTASDMLIERRLRGSQKPVYDAALVDGCNRAEAMLTALGQDPTIPDAEFPPIGWYRCALQYARFFCRDSELDRDAIRQLKAAEKKERVT